MLFRQVALQKLTSPQRLDDAIRVTSPMTWVLVAILTFAVATALAWSILGTTYTRVTGPAFIVYDEPKVAAVVATGNGTLFRLNVEQGDVITQDTVLAELSNPALVKRLKQQRRIADDIQAVIDEYEATKKFELAEFDRLQSQRRSAMTTRLVHATEMKDSFHRRLNNSVGLLSQSLTSVAAVDDLRALYFQARQDVESLENDMEQLSFDREQRVTAWNQQILEFRSELSRHLAVVAELEHELEQTAAIRSPLEGEVSEVLAPLGAHLNAGDVLLTIVRPDAELDALAFLNAIDAKLVSPGMRAQVSPTTMKKEEFGTIVGYVEEISNFPMSTEALFALLHNRDLASDFSSGGAPLVVRIEMEREDGQILWSSASPPPFELTAGTLATVSVIVREQAPITLLLPTVRRWSGLQ